MRRETVTVGRKSLSYLISEPAMPAVRQRPHSTVVFLHAFPLQSAMWEPNLGAMPDGWRAVAPGFRWEAGVGMSDLAGDVIDLLDHLDVTRAAIVGCSMGGYVLFEILKSAPRYISAMGLVSTRAGADNEEGRKNRQKMIELVDREGVEAIAAQMVPKLLGTTTQRERPEQVRHVRDLIVGNTPEKIKAAVTAMMERKDSTPLLEKIDVPALVMHGAEDALIPPTEAEGMHRAIRNSQLALIPLSGHLPNLEQPASFDGTLWTFLKKL
ncbi:MAG: alpha/beta fold hydrolase [Vicinamibacterales bacterium]